MQTFSLSSSHATSNRNSAASISEKPSHTAEHFGDVMHRALNGADAKQNHSDTPDSESESKSDRMKADKKRSAEKKSHHNSTTQISGMVGVPAATPAPAPTQNAGTANDSHETTGTTPVIPEVPAKTEVTNAATADIEATDASPESATNGQQTPTAPEAAKPISLPASDVTQELAAQSLDSASDPANPAETAPTGKSDPQMADITTAKISTESAPVSPPDPHGISAAKQDITMQKAEKTQKVAGLAEQDLPGITATSSEELPKGQKLSAKDASHGNEKPDSAMVEVPVRVVTSHASPAPTVTTAAAPATAIDTRILERTHDIVALHAMRLSEYTSDSLHVVVKPGAGIQLSLELRQSARGIEVHASLHKGDFDQLNRHWPDLQQRLEARGVRVGTLTTSENFTGSGQQFQQSKQQSPNQDSLYAGAFAEFALSGSMTEAPAARAARATAYRGWESWA